MSQKKIQKEIKLKCPTCKKRHNELSIAPYCSEKCFELMSKRKAKILTKKIDDEISDVADQILKSCKKVLENPDVGAKRFSMALYLLLHNYITEVAREGDFETSRLFSRAMIKTQGEVLSVLCERMNERGANIDAKKILKGLEELVYGFNRFGE